MQEVFKRELLGELSRHLGTEALSEVGQVLNKVLPRYQMERLGDPPPGAAGDGIYRYFEEFIRAKQSAGRPDTTISQYRYQIREYVSYIGKCPTEAVTEDINNFLDYVEDKRGLSKHSKALRRIILSSFYTWLQTNGYVRLNPVKRTEPIKYRSLVREALTADEMCRCRGAYTADLRRAAIFELFYSTGCRRAEIARMDLRDINWSGRYIKVLGKEDKERFVFFSLRAGNLLREYADGRTEGRVIISRRSGEPVGKQTLANELSGLGRLAGLSRPLHPHLLRHTFAVAMIEHGVSINDLSVIMGHTDLKTTAIYARSSLSRLQEEHARAID